MKMPEAIGSRVNEVAMDDLCWDNPAHMPMSNGPIRTVTAPGQTEYILNSDRRAMEYLLLFHFTPSIQILGRRSRFFQKVYQSRSIDLSGQLRILALKSKWEMKLRTLIAQLFA
jgi:hypothetical protein